MKSMRGDRERKRRRSVLDSVMIISGRGRAAAVRHLVLRVRRILAAGCLTATWRWSRGSSPRRSAYPFSFVVAGDSGAWPDPTAEAIYAQLLRQTAELEPVFFANLGDFAGPATRERHEEYLRRGRGAAGAGPVRDRQPRPRRPERPGGVGGVHGPRNFDFAYGHTRFVALDAAPGRVGELAVEEPGGVAGPREEALAFLAERLEAAEEPHKIVLMHCPPAFDGPLRAALRVGLQPRRARVPRARARARGRRSSAARTRSCSTTTSTTGRTS
jgi:hypothetical protein